MSGLRSRNKGKRAEREFSKFCHEFGYDVRRGQQYSGVGGEDVIGLDGMHVEVKHNESLNIHTAMAQSVSECNNKIPILAHKRNHLPWLITMRADDWLRLYKFFYVQRNKMLKGDSNEGQEK